MHDYEELRDGFIKGGICVLSATLIAMFVIGTILGAHEIFRIIGSYTSCIRPNPEMIKHCAEVK